MKTLRFISTGLFAVLLSFSIAACGDDEEEDEIPDDPTTENTTQNPTQDPAPEKSKRLVRIIEEEYSPDGELDDKNTYLLEYDSDGRVTSVIEPGIDGDEDDIYFISYKGNSITCEELESNTVTFRLSDGKIIWGKEDFYSGYFSYLHDYSYNSSNCLVEATSEISKATFTWSGDKLVEVYDNYFDYEDEYYSLKYDGKTCKGYNPVIVSLFGYQIMCEANETVWAVTPAQLGLRTNQLPTSMIDNWAVSKFTYELDDDGYLTKCIRVIEGEYEGEYDEYEEKWTEIYKFTWE